jgi:hypothetical protein
VLHLRFDEDLLFVEVSDGEHGEPRVRDAEGGRDGEGAGLGLFLVERLSRDWGVRQSPSGWKTVWAEMECGCGEACVGDELANADGLLALRSERERQLAAYERFLAVGERKLSAQATIEASFAPRVAALPGATSTMHRDAAALLARGSEVHDAAAAMHEQAAILHDRVACEVDERIQSLYDRYR